MKNDPLFGAIGWILKQIGTIIKLGLYTITILVGARMRGRL